jgi:hypothetical protein
MTRRLLRACWCAALLAPLGLAARGSAKPPDLPPESQNDVRPQLLDPDAAGNEDVAAAAGFLSPPATHLQPTNFTPVPLLPPIRVQEAPTGALQFGIGVNSDLGITGSILVAQASGSPCEPTAQHRELLPVPSLYRLRPSVRRQVMESLLFSAHPLMTLMPTDKLLDCPSDHPQKAAVDVLLDRMCECDPYDRCIIPGPRVNADPEALELRKSWRECQGDPQRREQLQRQIVTKALDMDVPLHVWSLSVVPQQHQLAYAPPDGQETSQPETSKPSCGACPGMCPRPAERHVYQFTAPDLTQDLLHNLEKLDTAHRLMHLAEHLALSGRVVEALDCFDIVCRMCPGRFEAHISEIMAQVFSPVYSGSTEDAEDGACEELPVPKEDHEETSCPSACPKCERLHAARAKGVPEQVEGLMQACRLAAEAGRHAKAAELARQAYALDAERVLADPLVYKMHLLALKRDKGKARHCRPDHGAGEGEPACPRAGGCFVPMDQQVPPPVDDGVVGALEQVLEEAEARPEPAPHPSGVSLHGGHFDVDCSWTGLRMQGHVPLHGSLYTVQFWNGTLSGWATPDPAAH